jgi:hypothetical protein
MSTMPMIGKMMGGNMKQAFEDQTYEVYVKGNKMARVGQHMSTIYDLDAGTITTISHDKQTYSTQTFEELAARMQEMQKRMNRGGGDNDVQFDVKVDKTGKTQTIDGETAKETLMTLTAKQASQDGQMVVTVHAWLVPVTPLSREVRDFDRRLAQKLASGMGGGSPALGSAGAGMAAAVKEMARLDDGFPALSETIVSGLTSAGGPMAGMAAMNGGSGNVDPNTPMIDTETTYHGFVSGVADDSKFSVPAGYTEQKARRR